LDLVFFALERSVSDGGSAVLTGGCDEANIGMGAEVAPAGWLAAAAIRAANSLESRFVFT
jgi:hypothetical protein